MFGFSDPWIVAVFLLCISSALLCIGWGIRYWNRDDGEVDESPSTVRHWVEEEDRVESEL